MRFSKKLLATLLPITAASTLVPVLSGCSKGSSWEINYGDEINCLDEKAENYHSLDDVKNSIKSRVPFEQTPTVKLEKLPVWSSATLVQKQMMYFDFIASLSVMENIKFHLVFNETATQDNFVLTYYKDGQQVTAKGTILSYNIHTAAELNVAITLQSETGDVKCHSYAYQYSKVE